MKKVKKFKLNINYVIFLMIFVLQSLYLLDNTNNLRLISFIFFLIDLLIVISVFENK